MPPPAGHGSRVELRAAACQACPFRNQRSIRETRDDGYELEFNDKDHRLAGRRREPETEVVQERYASCSSSESTR